MIANTGETLKGRGVFLLGGVGSTGLAVTVDVFRNDARIIAAVAATELDAADAPGVYQYSLAGASVTVAGEYLFHFLDTGGTSDQVDVYAQWYVRPWLVNLVANIWNYSRRTLTMAAALIKSMLRGQMLELQRGDTLDQDVVGLGDISTADDLWFTLKKQLSDSDASAEIQISLLGGLLAIAGATAGTPANGSITITDLVAGNITVALTAVEMAKLDVDFVGHWDVQSLTGVTVVTRTRGNARILGDSTRRIV